MKRKEYLKEKYWKDPVWSKVISFIIISIGTFMLGTLFIWFQNMYQDFSFLESLQKVISYLVSSIEINATVLWIGVIFIAIFLFQFIGSILQKIRAEYGPKLKDPVLPFRTGMSSTALFSSKISGAFPGLRGFQWYESKEAVKRLEKFFEPPLRYEPIGEEATSTPFWWFRGLSCMYIENFKKLTKRKILIDRREFTIKRIGVHVDQSYYKSFIYVESFGEKQTGLYNFTENDILRQIDSLGYSSEEYAIFKNRKISREHFDDGATIIRGKLVDTFDSDLRVRFLTDYNFIIAASQSPYNSRKFEKESGLYFNEILKRKIPAEEFINNLKSYEKNEFYN